MSFVELIDLHFRKSSEANRLPAAAEAPIDHGDDDQPFPRGGKLGVTAALSQSEIAHLVGISSSRVSQIEKRALAKIQQIIERRAAERGVSVREWLLSDE